MKQLFADFSSLLNAVALLLFGVALLPLLVLSFHNHPSAVDDYCFADTAVRYGVWQAQKFYYDGWTGRYFSNLIVHTSPLVWGWYNAYRFIPALLVLSWIGALYTMLSELMPTQPISVRLVSTGVLFFLYILMLPSTMESFFWLAAAASYTIPTIFSFYLIAVIIRWYRLSHPILRNLTAVWAGFLVFAVVGSSETNLVWMLLFLGGIIGYQILFQRKIDWFLIGLMGVALVSAWLLFRAPGNKIRMGGNPHSGELVVSAVASIGYLAKSVVDWLTHTPILVLSVFWLPIARRLGRSDHLSRKWFTVPPLLATLAYAGLLVALIFPSYYGIGIPPALRVMNVVYAFFLIGWFHVLTIWLVYADRKDLLGNRLTVVYSLPFVGVAALWIGFSALRSVPLKRLYIDWLSGRAAQYDQEMTARQRVLRDPTVTTVELPVLTAKPETIFNDDIHPTDTRHWWNRCQAGYYGKKVITLEPLTASQPASSGSGQSDPTGSNPTQP